MKICEPVLALLAILEVYTTLCAVINFPDLYMVSEDGSYMKG